VLTHGHHTRLPGAPVTVSFADGRAVPGTYLGVDEFFDQSLIRLAGAGPWPPVELGSAATLRPGQPCVLLGFPKVYARDARPPLLRVGHVLGCAGHHVFTSATTLGGDSGGPLFDLDGKLLGTHQLEGHATRGTGQVQIDVFGMRRDDLLAGVHVKRGVAADSLRLAGAAATAARELRAAVVTVVANGEPVALGCVVDGDGWLVTKVSELVAPVACRFEGGAERAATVVGVDAQHDVAVLRVAASGLRAVAFAAVEPPPGRGVATPVADGGCQTSTVGSPRIDVPPEYGELAIDVEPAAGGAGGVGAADAGAGAGAAAGVRVTRLWQGKAKTARALRVGDVITAIGATPTPDLASFFRARQLDGLPHGVVGRTIRLAVRRDGAALEVDAPVESRANIQIDEYHGRRSGFAAVFAHDRPLPRRQLGGPVVDADGRVAGLNIATEPGALTYALPAPVVAAIVERLRPR
jgi:serine protease Do